MLEHAQSRRGVCDAASWAVVERLFGSDLTRDHCHLSSDGSLLLARHLSSFFDPVTAADVALCHYRAGIIIDCATGAIVARSAPSAVRHASHCLPDSTLVRARPLLDGLTVFAYWHGERWNVSDGYDVRDPSFEVTHRDRIHCPTRTLCDLIAPLIATADWDRNCSHTFTLQSRHHRAPQYRDWSRSPELIDVGAAPAGALVPLADLQARLALADPVCLQRI